MPKYLTDLGITNRSNPKRRTFVADGGCPGLYLVIQPTGKKSWVVVKRLNGKLVKFVLGRFSTSFPVVKAREEAKKYIEGVDAGKHPRALWEEEEKARLEKEAAEEHTRRVQESETVAVVGQNWLLLDQANKRTYGEVTRFFENRLKPTWGNRSITSITKRDCNDFINEVALKTSNVRSRRIFAWLHRMFKWCIEQGILDTHPMAGSKKLGSETDRDKVLSDSELVEVWKASDLLDGDPRRGKSYKYKTNQFEQTGPLWGPIIKLLILTGARREEIGGLRWSEVDLDHGVLVLPGSRTKRLPKYKDKNRIIYLSPKAAEILEGMKGEQRPGCDFVFSTTKHFPIPRPVCGWEKAKTRLEKLIQDNRKKAGIKEEMPGWWIHDLRRTLATGLQRLGVLLQVTETVLGHLSGSRAGIVKIYQRYNFETESREAVERWANHVDDLLAGKIKEKVVAIKKAKSA